MRSTISSGNRRAASFSIDFIAFATSTGGIAAVVTSFCTLSKFTVRCRVTAVEISSKVARILFNSLASLIKYCDWVFAAPKAACNFASDAASLPAASSARAWAAFRAAVSVSKSCCADFKDCTASPRAAVAAAAEAWSADSSVDCESNLSWMRFSSTAFVSRNVASACFHD